MAVEYFISHTEGVVYVKIVDAESTAALISAMQILNSQPQLPSPCQLWVDLTRSDNVRSAFEVQRIVEQFKLLERLFSGRVALVAARPVIFGVARMAAAFAELEDFEVQVFRDTAAAAEWLGVAAIPGDEEWRREAHSLQLPPL